MTLVDLDLFNGQVKFGSIGFWMGNLEKKVHIYVAVVL